MIPAAGRPTGPIVWELPEEVKTWAPGRRRELYRLLACFRCGRLATLVGHGVRKRKRSPDCAFRVRCGRRGRPKEEACGKTFTLVPSWLYPYFSYSLEQICPVLLGRFGVTPPTSWRELARRHPAGDRTLMRWCDAFAGTAARWSEELNAVYAEIRQEFALPASITQGSASAVLHLAGLFLDWKERTETGQRLEEHVLLQRLWAWGNARLKIPLFLSTTNVKGRRQARARTREPPD